MKRNFFIIFASIAVIMLVFYGCSLSEEPTTEFTEPATEPTTVTEPVTVEKFTDEANPIPTKETTTEIQTEPQTTVKEKETKAREETTTFSSVPEIIGISSTGFDIVEQNGLTYVGGVLIANKTYSLPESYSPGALTSECKSAFKTMAKDAEAQGLDIYISSGFRSYSNQKNLYEKYCNKDGKAAADRYSARAGHSEHQTGLAIDLNTIKYSFADTAEGKWVAENCWKYGFILRYPENKEEITGYRYEPWHIRYVGVDMASKVYASGLCLEEYLGITSQYD